MGLSRKGWQRAINVLLWYPDNVKKYNVLVSDLLSRDPEMTGEGGNPLRPDPTASAAIRMAEDRKIQLLKSEIEAVEAATDALLPMQLEVIRRRFWMTSKQRRRKPRQFDFLQDLPYSRRQMMRIVRQVIVSVAEYLGEE